MSWIFACGLRSNRKSQPCIFFCWIALRFRVKVYAKNSGRLLRSVVERETNKTFVFSQTMKSAKRRVATYCSFRKTWNAEFFAYVFTRKRSANLSEKKYRAVIFYEIGDHMQKVSSFGRKKKTDQNLT